MLEKIFSKVGFSVFLRC